MKKLMLVGCFIFLAICSSREQKELNTSISTPSANNQTVEAFSSYPFPLVKWNDRVYSITQTIITDIDKEIGVITLQSSDCIADSPNNFSTTFSKGSKLYSIQGIAVEEAIAVRTGKDEYIKVIVPPRN